MKLLIATKNPGKAGEMQRFLGAVFETSLLPTDAPDVRETGVTFEENAVQKATEYFRLYGIPTVADDGGLEIDALNGEPGVYSRRWPGYEATDKELIDLALTKLDGVPPERRTAHLRTVGAFYDGTRTLTKTASIAGVIVTQAPLECEKGYPFRSIFFVPRFGKLFRDLTHNEHEQVNHRRVVFAELAKSILQGV